MWLWQRQPPHKPIQQGAPVVWLSLRQRYLIKLGGLIGFLHFLLLFFGFFICKDSSLQLINLQAVSGTVLFLPFQKSVAQASAPSSAPSLSSGVPLSNETEHSLKIIRTGSQKSPTDQSSQAVETKPEKPATSFVDNAKEVRQARRKRLQERARKRAEARKLAEEKKRKKLAEQKKREEAARKKLEKDKAKQKIESKKEEMPLQQIVQVAVAAPVLAATENVPSDAASIPADAIYVGQQDLDVLELQEAIHTQVAAVWRPPAGIMPGKVCKARVQINWQGRAEEIVIEESSKVLVFDMSVRQALTVMEFPKSAYGKELILPFRS